MSREESTQEMEDLWKAFQELDARRIGLEIVNVSY